ncbi:MAG: hypothetical protein WDM87_00540 [Terracidiphilus sp.]
MGIFMWILVGLVAGWLTGKIMKGSGYGFIVDILLGHRRCVDRRLYC